MFIHIRNYIYIYVYIYMCKIYKGIWKYIYVHMT